MCVGRLGLVGEMAGRGCGGKEIPGDCMEEGVHSPSACRSQAKSRLWMNLSPPVASSPAGEGQPVRGTGSQGGSIQV